MKHPIIFPYSQPSHPDYIMYVWKKYRIIYFCSSTKVDKFWKHAFYTYMQYEYLFECDDDKGCKWQSWVLQWCGVNMKSVLSVYF